MPKSLDAWQVQPAQMLVALLVNDILEEEKTVGTFEEMAEKVRERGDRLHWGSLKDLLGGAPGRKVNEVIRAVEEAFLGNEEMLFYRPSKRIQREGKRERRWQHLQDPAERERTRHTMELIRDLLQEHRRTHWCLTRETIRCGCSAVPGGWLVPEIFKTFQDADSNRQFDVNFTIGLPNAVRGLGLNGELDLVIASVDKEKVNENVWDEVRKLNLPVQLVLNRRDTRAQEMLVAQEPDKRRWDALSGYLVIIQSKFRDPPLKVPYGLFPIDLATRRAESYSEALATVRACGSHSPVACLACLDIHSPEDRQDLCGFDMPGIKDAPVCLTALFSRKAFDQATPAKRQLLNDLKKHIEKYFRELQRRIENKPFEHLFRDFRSTFHVTHKPRFGQPHNWVRGSLERVAIRPDGHFHGCHVVYNWADKELIRYSIAGHVNRDLDDVYHVSWRGTKELQPDHEPYGRQEDYSVSFMFTERDLGKPDRPPWVGTWLGTSSWKRQPDMGYFIVRQGDWDGPKFEVPYDDELKRLIDEFDSQQGELHCHDLKLNVPTKHRKSNVQPTTKRRTKRTPK